MDKPNSQPVRATQTALISRAVACALGRAGGNVLVN